MEKVQGILLTVAILVFLVILFLFVTKAISKYTGYAVTASVSSIESCLFSNNVMLFINSDNPSLVLSKIKANKILSGVHVRNCYRDYSSCSVRGINYFPSWEINGNIYKGDVPESKIRSLTGC